MSKYSDKLERNERVINEYVEKFGEDALIPYVSDIDDAIRAYELCLKENKSYEELYGVKFDKNVNY